MVEGIGPEGQRGKLRPHVASIAMNLWGHDLLQQWKTQINIPPISGVNHKRSYYQEQPDCSGCT